MALKARLDSLEGLPEDISAHYTQDGETFVLDVESVNGLSLEDVTSLKQGLAAERGRLEKAEKLLKTFGCKRGDDGWAVGDLDPETAKAAQAKLAEMADWTPEDKVREQIEAREAVLLKKHETEVTGLTTERDHLMSQLEKNLIRAAATAAITEHKGNVDLLLPHVERQCVMTKDATGDFIARVTDNDGTTRISLKQGSTDPMGIGELVETMKGETNFMPAFAGTGATGSGAPGSSSAGGTGNHTLSADAARDPVAYRAAKAAAETAGTTLQITE